MVCPEFRRLNIPAAAKKRPRKTIKQKKKKSQAAQNEQAGSQFLRIEPDTTLFLCYSAWANKCTYCGDV